MRLGLDVSTVRAGATGVGYVVYHLWRALRAHGGLECVPLVPHMTVGTDSKPPAYRPYGWPTRLAWLQWELPSVLRDSNLDILHFPNYLAPLRCPLPYVVHFHDLSVFRYPHLQPLRKRWIFRVLLGRVARSAACVVTVSHAMAREITEYFRLPPDRVAAVWNGYDPVFGPVGREAQREVCRRYGLEPPFFLFVGAIHPRKNLGTLLQAVDVLRRQGYPHRLVVVGPWGWQYHAVLRLWRRLSLEDRVRFLGYVPRSDLVALYNAATALVYPSLYEGFGLPVVEAMACGTPVAASRIPALQEVGGPAVYWVEPRDVSGWAEAMARLADDGDLRDDLRAAGWARASQFSWERTAAELVRLYKRVLGRTAPSAGPDVSVRSEVRHPDEAGLATAVQKGLLYFALFKHPVTLTELYPSLPDRAVPLETLSAFLNTRPWPELRVRDGYYAWCEAGESIESWLARRQRREQAFEALWARYGRHVGRLARLPYVRMVGLSGGGMFGTDVRDLDLFIITRPRRVALVYWMIVLLTRMMGVRSVLCANYLIDETALTLPEQDYYTAHQVIHLRPLVGYDHYLAFWTANPWVTRLFPNAHPCPPDRTAGGRVGSRWLEWVLDVLGGPLWNEAGLWLLRWWLRPKVSPASALRLTSHVLKLHLYDYRQRVLARLERLWPKTEATPTVTSNE